MSNFPEVFSEAAAALDLFPVGHAQFVQQRLRAGLIDGGAYHDFININRKSCTTCFYGALAMCEGITPKPFQSYNDAYQKFLNDFKQPFSQKFYRIFTGFEDWLLDGNEYEARIGVGDTPTNNENAQLFDDFLSAYIAERQLRDAEVTCELLPVEEMVAL